MNRNWSNCRENKMNSLLRGNPDRLSDLPDSLLIQILSFLDMKDVVKTSVLCKRWKLLWTLVDTIVYDFCSLQDNETMLSCSYEFMQEKSKLYVSFIDKSLIQCVSRIRKFSLSGLACFDYFTFPDFAIIEKWIENVLESKVEIMKLDYTGISYWAPPSLFQCSSLTQLELSFCHIGLSVPVNLPLLKSLSLDGIYLADECLEKILLGCPVLETLFLTGACVFNVVRIISTSLKRVEIVGIEYAAHSADQNLEIRAPLLQELEVYSTFMVRKCVIADCSSLVKANLMFSICSPEFLDDNGFVLNRFSLERSLLEAEFDNDWIRMVTELLKSLRHVGELLIGADLLQVLTLSGKPSPTFMCKHLTLVSPLWKYDLPGIVFLLEAAPHLETLVVDVSRSESPSPFDQVKEALSVAHMHLFSRVNGNLLHLKNVEISYQQNPCSDCPPDSFQIEEKCFDFELVDYILRSCIDLERLVLGSSRACSNETKCLKPYCAFQYVNQLSSNLLMYSLPRNENAEWELKEWEFALELHIRGILKTVEHL